jgi:hypothetical protein
MIMLKEIMEAFDYKVSGGAEYLWKCFPNARYIEFESEYAYVNILISTVNQTVYEAVVDIKTNDEIVYRWFNPEYIDAYKKEYASRSITMDLDYQDVIVFEDFLEKATAIFNGDSSFDTRISMPIDIEDDVFLILAKVAHEKDITFNQYIQELIESDLINKFGK